jgi:protein-S-isoprenylcysteine O-methyltransferase Ste14
MRFRARFIGVAALVLVAAAALGAVVMLLWNAVIPLLFSNAHLIDYPHALGLLVLCRILFGGFRGHGGWHGRRHFAKWQAMTPEEREKLVRCGPWGRHLEEQVPSQS